MAIIIPQLPIRVVHPAVNVSEHDKFSDNGKYFYQMGQWIALNYFNTYSVPTTYTQPLNASKTTTAAGTSVNNSQSNSIVDEMLDNLSYYYGNQNNRIFNNMTKGVNNNTLPNIWIKGQEVRSLVDHLIGKGLELIEPIEDNISCETISQNTLLKKQEIFDKIDLGAKIGDVLNELGQGIKYNPAGEIDYSNPSAIKEAKEKIKREYENTGTIIARNAYYTNNLKQIFLNSVSDTAICNLTGVEFVERNGKLESNYIPGWQGIYDFSTWGEFGEGQTLGGYIVPVTMEEILHEYPDMNPLWTKEIQDVLYNGVDNAAQFIDYYNQPFTNVLWWYNDQKWLSKAVVYWLGECDSRYVEKNYTSGLKKVFKIDDYKNYYDPSIDASNLPSGTQMMKGYEIPGKYKVWKVHKSVILGNKYLVEYGYDTYQVRPFGNKQRPQLPVQFFCQGKLAGYVKSVVSRIKPKQDELDAVRYRIREYASNDLGNNILINGSKLTEDLKALDIINDFRTMHVSVIPATGDAEIDKMGISDLVTVFKNDAAAAIKDYLILKADIAREMKEILNIPDIALGEQRNIQGKGVQAATIARSEISSLPFFSSLETYWQKILQYAANKNKMIMLDSKDKDVVLPISNREVKILTLTKDFQYEDLMCYINPNDNIEAEELALLKQMLQGFSQNPSVDHMEGIAVAMTMMQAKSYGEGIATIQEYINKKRKDNEQLQLQQATSEQQTMAAQQQSAQILAMQQQIAKLTGDLAKVNLQGAWALKEKEVQAGIDTEKELSSVYIDQITKLIQEQFSTLQQGSQPPAQQPSPEAQAA